MAIWDIIGNSTDQTAPDVLNASLTNVLGDSVWQLVGGGRFFNIVGADQKFQFDWELLMDMGFDQLGMKEGLLGDFITFAMGNGGNSYINIGDNNSVNLLGGQLLNSKIGHEYTANLDDPWPHLPASPTPQQTQQYESDMALFLSNYRLVAGLTSINTLLVIIVFFIIYFKYNNFKDTGSGSMDPSIEDTKAIILGTTLGVENRIFLYVNNYLHGISKAKSEAKILADQQAKTDAQNAVGAEIAKAQAVADKAALAAADGAAAAQAAAASAAGAQATAEAAWMAAGQATADAAEAAAAAAENAAYLNEELANLELRLGKVIDSGLLPLQQGVAQQSEMLAATNGVLAKMEENLDSVLGNMQSAIDTIGEINKENNKSFFSKLFG